MKPTCLRIVPLVVLCLCSTPLTASPFSTEVRSFAHSKSKCASMVVVKRLPDPQKPSNGQPADDATFAVVRVLKLSPRKVVRERELISLRGGTPLSIKPGDLALLIGDHSRNAKHDELSWSFLSALTPKAQTYISQAPAYGLPDEARATYFIKHLDHSDTIIRTDAWIEFQAIKSEVKQAHAKLYDRKQLRAWITRDLFASPFMSSYGEMLGYCGTAEDAKFLESLILGPLKTEGHRMGLEGLMIGYLWFAGEPGLKVLEDTKLKPKYLRDAAGNTIPDDKGKPTKYPFTETYQAMQAVRFLWNHGNGRIPRKRLQESMYLILERPEMADLAISDLARWGDWSVQDRLMKMFHDPTFDSNWVKVSIVRYMLQSSYWPPEKTSPEPEYVIKGKKYVETLRKMDPELVKKAERFFIAK